MARQTYYVTREQRHPLYRTRMLQAGPLDLDASAARLYRRMGVEMSDKKPGRVKVPEGELVTKGDTWFEIEVPAPPKRETVSRSKKKTAPKKKG